MADDFEGEEIPREEDVFPWGKSDRPEGVRIQLGNIIRDLRETQELSRKNLATFCKLNVYHLEKIENGRIEKPDMEALMVLSEAVGVRFSKNKDRFNELIAKLTVSQEFHAQRPQRHRAAAASASGH